MKLTRFVRINLHGDGLEIWGMSNEGPMPVELLPLWSSDWSAVDHEFGSDGNSNGMTDKESNSTINAEHVDTPDEAWAALAHYQLTGERMEIC